MSRPSDKLWYQNGFMFGVDYGQVGGDKTAFVKSHMENDKCIIDFLGTIEYKEGQEIKVLTSKEVPEGELWLMQGSQVVGKLTNIGKL